MGRGAAAGRLPVQAPEGTVARPASGGWALLQSLSFAGVSSSRLHRTATRVLSGLMVVIGVAIVATTLARGGGPAAVGVVVGVLFVAAGAARLYLLAGSRDG